MSVLQHSIREVLRPVLQRVLEPDYIDDGGGTPPSSTLKFSALLTSPDVHVGTGGLALAHTSTLYVKNETSGLYESFGTDVPLWLNGYLYFYPAATNTLNSSNDLRQGPNWSYTGAIVNTFDQVGIRGLANEATLLDKQVVGDAHLDSGGATYAASGYNTAVFRVKKKADQTFFPALSVVYNFGTDNAIVHLNLETGVLTQRILNGTGAWEIHDDGDFWMVLIELENTTAATGGNPVRIWPAHGTVAGSANTNALGSITVGQVQWHLGKRIADVLNLGPIFTSTAPVSTDAVVESFDSANSADTTSAWYMEVASGGAQNILDGFLSITGANFQLSDGTTTVTRPWTANTVHKVGIAYGDSLMSINVDGTASADVAYDGAMLQGILDLFRTGSFPAKKRDIRRYDAVDYATAKAVIAGLVV